MPPSKDELTKGLQRCRPDEPLTPNDRRYVELHDEPGGDGPLIRGEDAILPLVDTIGLRPDGSCQLFSGYIGTGKSTELLRLRDVLQRQNYTVFYADALEYHDLAHELATRSSC